MLKRVRKVSKFCSGNLNFEPAIKALPLSVETKRLVSMGALARRYFLSSPLDAPPTPEEQKQLDEEEKAANVANANQNVDEEDDEEN